MSLNIYLHCKLLAKKKKASVLAASEKNIYIYLTEYTKKERIRWERDRHCIVKNQKAT